MSVLYDYHDYSNNPDLATEALGSLFAEGTLCLVLGAGISSGFGLPSWAELVARIAEQDDKRGSEPSNEEFEDARNRELAQAVDPFDDGSTAYKARVKEALYQTVDGNLLDRLSRSPLLLAIGSLVTGNRLRTVFTYNYDDLLEQYLTMLGHPVRPRVKPTEYIRDSHVTVNHVHGYLPQDKPIPEDMELILSAKSFRRKRAHIDGGWSQSLGGALHGKSGLFLGLSGEDESLLDRLQRLRDDVARERGDNYLGYWLLTPKAYERRKEDLLQLSMCPIPLKAENIPQFVLKICQRANEP